MDEEIQASSSSALGSDTVEEGNGVTIDDLHPLQAKAIITSINGMIFKVHNAFFKVTYINYGQRRFTAQLINQIVEK